MNIRKKLIRDSFLFDGFSIFNSTDDYSLPYKDLSLDELYNNLDQAVNQNIKALAKNMHEFGAIHKFLNLAKSVKEDLSKKGYYYENRANISKMYSLITPSIPKAIASAALIFIGVALILTSVAAAVLSGCFATPISIAGITLGLTLLKAAALITTTLGLASLIGGGVLAKKAHSPISHPEIKNVAEHLADKAYKDCKRTAK